MSRERPDASLHEEIHRFPLEHPHLTRVYRGLVRRRTIIFLAIICLISTYDIWLDGFDPMDPIRFFGPAGLRLFSSDWANTFREPGVQIGPGLAAIFGLGALLQQRWGLDMQLVVSPLVQILVLFGTLRLVSMVRAARGVEFPQGLQFFAGLSVLLGGIAWETSSSAHPAESLGALLWVAAAVFSIRGQPLRGAMMIASATLLKPWGLLGMPLLLLNPKVPRALLSGALALTMSVAAYLPFAIWGQMRMFDIQWRVTPQSPLRIVLPVNGRFDWNMRLIQGALTIALATALVLVTRRSARAYWLAPLQISLVRIVLDPLVYHYYFMTPALIIIVGLLSELPPRPSWRRLAVPLVFYALVWPHFYMKGMPLAVLTILLISGMVAHTIYAARRSLRSQALA